MVININQTYCDHFAMYTNVESLHCTPETNMLLYLQLKKKNVREETEKRVKELQQQKDAQEMGSCLQ